MNDFPEFMKNPLNAIDPKSQSPGNVGYVYDGIDGSQMAFWTSRQDVISKEHVHPVRNDARLEFLTGFMTMTNISSWLRTSTN